MYAKQLPTRKSVFGLGDCEVFGTPTLTLESLFDV
jgi:hypothetical protein